MGGGTLAVIAWSSNTYGEAVARTMGLITFSISNLAFSFATKDERHSMFSLDILGDRPFDEAPSEVVLAGAPAGAA